MEDTRVRILGCGLDWMAKRRGAGAYLSLYGGVRLYRVSWMIGAGSIAICATLAAMADIVHQ